MVTIFDLKINDIVETPRFLKVNLHAIFFNKSDCINSGYTEPTHFTHNEIEIFGKSLGNNRMIFAACSKNH